MNNQKDKQTYYIFLYTHQLFFSVKEGEWIMKCHSNQNKRCETGKSLFYEPFIGNNLYVVHTNHPYLRPVLAGLSALKMFGNIDYKIELISLHNDHHRMCMGGQEEKSFRWKKNNDGYKMALHRTIFPNDMMQLAKLYNDSPIQNNFIEDMLRNKSLTLDLALVKSFGVFEGLRRCIERIKNNDFRQNTRVTNYMKILSPTYFYDEFLSYRKKNFDPFSIRGESRGRIKW